MGILTIVLMYNMRKNKMYCIGIGCAVLTLLSLNEITCFLAMIPVHFYNGKRGGGEVWICCANRREILLNILLNFQRIPQKLFAANHFKILRLKIFA